MPKKRRKLNKDFEKEIYSSKKNVELVLAKIYDIDDEDIQKEYMSAFNEVVYLYDELKENYQQKGFDDNSEDLSNRDRSLLSENCRGSLSMHTFAKLPLIRPIKIQMLASKYGTKFLDKSYYF